MPLFGDPNYKPDPKAPPHDVHEAVRDVVPLVRANQTAEQEDRSGAEGGNG